MIQHPVQNPKKLCYNCHKYGHILKYCTKPNQQRKQDTYNLIKHVEKLNKLVVETPSSHKQSNK